ncbi:armadillo-type protein [Cokeromyces recurvatus]|uniref:armadillo-type protein n=1 Tax=Cokeromyces recurvatus TaxID=90255 RepID=UPI00221F7FA1|nr:armadillo-type protein [Cokeromyces recurvatus]KAI7906992.1 armadillo-type protein [Cokeromyces recurvatus]
MVREQTVDSLNRLISYCEKGEIKNNLMEKLLDHMTQRIKKETTEEIRVAWMELCVKLSKQSDSKISIKISELFMDIMQIAGEDLFADVQKECAKLIVLYSNTQSKSVDYACERMIRLTMPILTHKHAAVRVSGIKAMEAVLMASPKGLHSLFEYNEKLDKQPIIPGLIYDTSAFVRDNLFTVLGNLLCQWPPRERYQYGEMILPIILSGTFDELPTVQTTCQTSLSKVAKSCTQDLYDAGILQEIPTDEKIVENTGLKHLVHMCFEHSLDYLLHSITDFIKIRQETALDSLKLFLEYVALDDLVRRIKKIIHYLFIAYANQMEISTRDRILGIINLLLTQLPSPELYLDVLLLKLEKSYLAKESNGYPGNITIAVVMDFLEYLCNKPNMTLSESTQQRILNAINKPYLKEYAEEDKLAYSVNLIKASLNKTINL